MKWLYFSGLVFCVAACTNTPTTPVATTDSAFVEKDTINYALNEDSVKMQMANTPAPEGFYQVVLPCTDCKGIEHTVLFNPDLSFSLEENVLESKNDPTKKSGTWKPVNGNIWLYKDSSVVARYQWKSNTLNYMDLKSGVLLPLRQLETILNNETWKTKQREGIEAYAVGTEPFWNLSIDAKKGLVLTMADWPKPRTFKYTKPLTSGDSAVYQTGKDTALLRVIFYNRFGNDGMSDVMYPNKVSVYYKNATLWGSGAQFK